MSMQRIKAPLTLYIVWHPDFIDGQLYADHFYSSFYRDSNQPLERGVGIPVFFRSVAELGAAIRPIDFSESDKSVIVLLIEQKMMLDRSWRPYVEALAATCRDPSSGGYLIPIALIAEATSYGPIGDANAIRFPRPTASDPVSTGEEQLKQLLDERLAYLRRRVLYQLCWLYRTTAADAQTPGIASSQPKLFLSHAKLDGEQNTVAIRDYINNEPIIDRFFDVQDIGYGRDFAAALKHYAASSAALIVFLTDAYSSRQWCRIEALTAKRHYCPIVVVNAIEHGEKRSFPYLGNVPTIRWTGTNAAEIVELAMSQVLYNLHAKVLLRKQSDLYGHPDRYLLTNSPELFDLVHLKQLMEEDNAPDCVVLYPEPPLGTEELLLLTDSESRIVFLTPALLPVLLPRVA